MLDIFIQTTRVKINVKMIRMENMLKPIHGEEGFTIEEAEDN